MTAPAEPLAIGAVIPPALAPRVMAALRADYGQVTGTLSDQDAGNAVVAYLVEFIMTSHEGRQAQAGQPAELERVAEQYRQAAHAAREKAQRDAAVIRDAARGRGQEIRDRVLGQHRP